MKVPQYAIYPVLSLVDRWQWKLPISLGSAWIWQFLEPASEILSTLFTMDPRLAVMALALYVVDWITGIGRVLYVHGPGGLQSDEFRRAGWKFMEYVGVIVVALSLANGTSHTWASPIFAWMREAAPIYVALTEGFSVWENVTRSEKGASRIMVNLQNILAGNWEELDKGEWGDENGDETLDRSRPNHD